MTPQDIANGLYVPGSLSKKELYKLVHEFGDFLSSKKLSVQEIEHVGNFWNGLDPVLTLMFWTVLQREVGTTSKMPAYFNLYKLHPKVNMRMANLGSVQNLTQEETALINEWHDLPHSSNSRKPEEEFLRRHGYID